jgi:hypothetical protein
MVYSVSFTTSDRWIPDTGIAGNTGKCRASRKSRAVKYKSPDIPLNREIDAADRAAPLDHITMRIYVES